MSSILSKTLWRMPLKEGLMNSRALLSFKNKDLLLQGFLIVIYAVGMLGFSHPDWREKLQPTSGFILYLSTIVVAMASRNKSKFFIFLAIAFLIGFGAEAIGVNSGYLFGNYQYGSNLGPKFLEVSIVIGFLWGVLALSAASIVERIVLFNKAKVFFGAVIMLLVDVIMEPVAIENNFWNWKGGEIPLFNYACWFGVAFILQWILRKLKLFEKNKVYDTLLVLMVLFFGFLNLY